MKLTRGQLRAFEDRTQGFVDELQVELSQSKAQETNGDVTMRFHHLRITADVHGRWWVVNERTEEQIAEGAVETISNEDWQIVREGLDS